MTREDAKKAAELLLKDLCARIPYEVVGKCELDASYDTSFDTIFQTHKFDAVVYGLNEDLYMVMHVSMEMQGSMEMHVSMEVH